MVEGREKTGAAVWAAIVVGVVLVAIILAYAIYSRLNPG